MTGSSKSTNLNLRLLGTSPDVMENPAEHDAIVAAVDAGVPAAPSGATQVGVAGSSAIVVGTAVAQMVQKVTLTVTALAVSVANANDYGSAKLWDFPTNNLSLLAAEMNLTAVKGNTTNGILDASTAVKVGLGTAAASNATLSSTMVNILDKVTLAGTHSAAAKAHSNDNATAALGLNGVLGIDNSASLYVNVETGNITADDTLTLTGTVDLYFVNVGAD